MMSNKLEMPQVLEKVIELIKEGYKPYKDRDYIVLRKGNSKRSLGRYSEELWNQIQELYNQYAPHEEQSSPVRGLLTTGISKPPEIPGRIRLDLETLAYYQWIRSKGLDWSLSDFINNTIKLFFKEHGIQPMIVIGMPIEYGIELKDERGKFVAIESPDNYEKEEEVNENE